MSKGRPLCVYKNAQYHLLSSHPVVLGCDFEHSCKNYQLDILLQYCWYQVLFAAE